METELEKLEDEVLHEVGFIQVPPPEIVAYNELRSCADLYRMHTQKILDISPEFQRDVVWKGPMQTRFVDSMIKQLPIPSMCFAQDYKKQKWIVIDGLQRINTIVRFLSGEDWTLSKLEDVDSGIAGKSVAAIKTSTTSLHQYYTRVENLSIPITVLRCDFDKQSHQNYLFTIFHRLNTGGMRLNNQEIRNCIYGGAFNQKLKELDKYPNWRRLNGMRANEHYRFVKQELALRVFAFVDKYEEYTGHLAKFLNDYMSDHRDPHVRWLDEKTRLLHRTADVVWEKAFGKRRPSKIPLTLLEGLLVGVARNIDALAAEAPIDVAARFERLRNHPHYSEGSLIEGLSKKPKVLERLATAIGLMSE